MVEPPKQSVDLNRKKGGKTEHKCPEEHPARNQVIIHIPGKYRPLGALGEKKGDMSWNGKGRKKATKLN